MSCPHCHEPARFVEYRRKGFVSLLGELQLARGYYHCRACKQGTVPWDATLRLPNRFGADNESILSEVLGYDAATIARWREEEVLT